MTPTSPQTHSSVKTWHDKYLEDYTLGDKIADRVAGFVGSWKFIGGLTTVLLIWMTLNMLAYVKHWDPYPFFLLGLILTAHTAFAAPFIMMSQKRQNDRDRHQAIESHLTNLQSKGEIEELQNMLSRIENRKLDLIIQLLIEQQEKNQPATAPIFDKTA